MISPTTIPYDHFEHRHRFAVWAGARAAQRAFTTVENLRDALQSTTICAFLRDPTSLETDDEVFEVRHRNWCNSIVQFLSAKNIRHATFGRAAKLIAVYLKAMVVVGEHSQSRLAAAVHPPIDRILLRNLLRSTNVISPTSHTGAQSNGRSWTSEVTTSSSQNCAQ